MRVFVAGAAGAIGRSVVAQLIERGHDVVGSYRSSSAMAERLRAARAGWSRPRTTRWTRARHRGLARRTQR